jgi:hypothetical protein
MSLLLETIVMDMAVRLMCCHMLCSTSTMNYDSSLAKKGVYYYYSFTHVVTLRRLQRIYAVKFLYSANYTRDTQNLP